MHKYNGMFFDGMGSINPTAIRLVLDLEKDRIKDEELVTQKLVVYLSEVLRVQHEKDKKTMKSGKPKETLNGK